MAQDHRPRLIDICRQFRFAGIYRSTVAIKRNYSLARRPGADHEAAWK